MQPGSRRKWAHLSLVLAGGVLCASTLLSGRTITVDDDGPADFQSIQAAIDDPGTVPGDVVSVAPGTYLENLVLKCGVSVVGAGLGTTTVYGGGNGPVATISGCGPDTRLQGFRLTNGRGDSGGGVSVAQGAPVITLNLITGNVAGQRGGGMWLYRTDATVSQNLIMDNASGGSGGGISASQNPVLPMARPLITRNQISRNQAPGGAGIQIDSTDAIVTNNLITGNRASDSGGGMGVNGGGLNFSYYYGYYPFPTISISNNTLAGNLSGSGGGLQVGGETGRVANNVIYDNRASVGGGGMILSGNLTSLETNIFFLNSPDDCSASPCSGSGNLISDPLLLDPAAGDYRLGAGSPAIDSGLGGALPDDLRGQSRPLDGNFDGLLGSDLGAFEYDADELLGLRFVSESLLTWGPIPGATSFHIYSGDLATLRSGGLDTCRDEEDADRSDLAFADTLTPAAGTGLAYVVTAVLGDGISRSRFEAGDFPRSIAIGDFNADGRQDLAVANGSSDDVSVLLGLGDGRFGPQRRFGAGDGPSSVEVGDFNADGRQDLAVANASSGDASILLGLGDGRFGPQSRFGAGVVPTGIAVGDFNADGRQDLAVANATSRDASILLGLGDGSFGSQRRFGAGDEPSSIAVGDFNADGRQDLVVANSGATLSVPDDVSVLLGLGDGSFGPQSRFAAGEEPRSVAIGDFDADGRQDLAVANGASDDVSVLPGLGNGTFGPQSRFGVGGAPWSVAAGDFNADGRQDLMAANAASADVSFLPGVGDGSFDPGFRFAAGDFSLSFVVGDFNADGRHDLALTNATSDDVSVLLRGGVETSPARKVEGFESPLAEPCP